MLNPVSPPSKPGGAFGDPPDTDTYEETELKLKSSRTSHSESYVIPLKSLDPGFQTLGSG